jgi:hypothetical protein
MCFAGNLGKILFAFWAAFLLLGLNHLQVDCEKLRKTWKTADNCKKMQRNMAMVRY